jgi:phosphatidylglycerophosphatase C
MDLALFDFDGTITAEPTYPGFVRFAVRPRRKLVGGLILSPLIVGYRSGLVSDRVIRRVISRVAFWREDPNRIRGCGERYAAEVLPGMIGPMALERIAWHKARGDRVVVVSASLDAYLAPWCRTLGVEVICTQLETKDGVLTGRYVQGDCCGEEKSRRIRERYTLDSYSAVYAYGDTEEDRQMLAIADKRYFRWEEVSD